LLEAVQRGAEAMFQPAVGGEKRGAGPEERNCRAIDKRDELPPSHSITSSVNEERRWNSDIEQLRCLEVHQQLKTPGLLDW